MLPNFNRRGTLPPGVHFVTWKEFVIRFRGNNKRILLLKGLRLALIGLASAECNLVYIDGSFVTAKSEPGDFDACWSVSGVDINSLDPVFLDLSDGRSAQKSRFGGELFPADLPEGASGKRFLDFFQTDRDTGRRKGIVGIRLSILDLITGEPESFISEEAK